MTELKERISAHNAGYDYDEFHEVVGDHIILYDEFQVIFSSNV